MDFSWTKMREMRFLHEEAAFGASFLQVRRRRRSEAQVLQKSGGFLLKV